MATTIPTLTPKKMQGNLAKNWDFFKQMWTNYSFSLNRKISRSEKTHVKGCNRPKMFSRASTIEFNC